MPAGNESNSSNGWSYPVITHGSKLGIHSVRPNGVRQFAQTAVDGGAAFPVIKAVDDLSWLREVKEVSPQTITIARLVSPLESCSEAWHNPDPDLGHMADALLQIILDKIATEPSLLDTVDYWEVANEPAPSGSDAYRILSQLMIECMQRAERENLKLAIFTFNAGTPEWEEMIATVESGVFTHARQGGHILALHEGVFSPQDPVDKWWNNLIPGAPRVEGAGALCFRYRYLYHLLQQRGEVVPLIVSEWCGYDQRPLSPDQVVDRVRWYDAQAQSDYWLWAFCPFTLGPLGGWETHDYEFSYPKLIEYMQSIRDRENAAAPDATGGTTPHHTGKPRTQYERVYVLLPPDAEKAWVLSTAEATWDSHHYTIGGSADDAGIGDLEKRTVIAVNPSHWPDDLELFFETHYPGVRYIPIEAASPTELIDRLGTVEL